MAPNHGMDDGGTASVTSRIAVVLASLANRLAVETWRSDTDTILSSLCASVGTSAASLFELRPAAGRWDAVLASTWPGREGADPEPETIGELSEWWLRILTEGRAVLGAGENASYVLRALERSGRSGSVIVPVVAGDDPWGFITLEGAKDVRRWSETDLALLGAIGSVIGAAIAREGADRHLRDAELRYQTLVEHPSRDREASHTIAKKRSDRQADDEHGELETRFRTLVEQIPAIVYIWSVKGSLDEVVEEFVSPQIEEVLGYPSEEWMANPRLWIDTLHPDDRDEVISETTRSFEAGEPFKMEYRVLAKDGRVVWLHDVASVVSRDEQGRATRYQGVQLDITARKEAEHAQRRVVEKLQRLDQQRRHLLVRSTRTQEEERRRIADDIHDDTMQRLLAIPMWLESAAKHHPEIQTEERFVKLQEVVADAVARLRHMVFELHPRILDDEGIVVAIRAYLDGWTKLGASSRFEITNELTSEPPRVTRLLLYRIVQEALTNARRHAEASLVSITLKQRAGGFEVIVADDGIGFDVHAAQGSADGHSGLSSMLERAEVAGGWCRVESRPGRTTVAIWVPERAPADTPLGPERWTGPSERGVAASVDGILTARGLSPREIEVARLLALGHTNAEIAASLYLSVRTIEHHRASVFRKLRVHSRAALVSEMREGPASVGDRSSPDA